MIDEFQLAEELKFPVNKMSGISIKKRMRSLIGQAKVSVVKLNRETWYVKPEDVPILRATLWESKSPNAKAPRTGNSGGRSKGKKSTNLQEYLTPEGNAHH